MASRILSAIAATYGRDSKEYEMAGGKPPGTYRRSHKSTAATDVTNAQPNAIASGVAPSNGVVLNGAGTLAS